MSSGGQIVGGALGAVAGFFLAGPLGVKAATAMMYGAQIGMMAGGYLDPPKGPTINGPRLSDLSVQTSTYGSVIPRVYGTVTVNGNVFWLENNTIKETVTKKKQGGKGGGAKSTTRTYTYSATFAVGLCKGPIAGVRRIWIGADLYYDAGSNDPATIQASNAAATGFEVYNGTDTQAADPRIQATLGVANTPAWRGLAYIVFSNLPLANYGNSLAGAQVRVEVMQTAVYGAEGFSYAAPDNRWLRTAQFKGKYWSAGGNNGPATPRLCHSPDGQTWTTSTALDFTDAWLKMANNDSVALVFAGYGDGRVARSSDLVSWTTISSPGGELWWQNVIVNGQTVLALGSISAATTDGVTWSTGTAPTSPSVTNSYMGTHNGSVYCIALSANAGRLATSVTGLSAWVTRTVPGFNYMKGVTTGPGGLLVALGELISAGNRTHVVTSIDNGVTWSAPIDIPFAHNTIQEIAWNGFEYIVPEINYTYLYTSPDLANWTRHNHPDSGLFWGPPVWGGAFWNMIQANNNEPSRFVRFRTNAVVGVGSPTLGTIVSAECLESGLLTAADLDITALTQTVRGYRIGSLGSIRAALEPLQAAWPFDIVQAGYKIKFVARGGASVVTIPASDLDARSDGSAPGVQLTTVREMDSQLPRRVTVQYLDHAREYNTGVQYAERLNTSSVNSLTLELPIVLTATEAAGKAEVLLYMYWLERHDLLFNLPPTYNQLEPGDVVTLNMPEGTSSLRLVSVTNSSDGRVECQAKRAAAAIYTPAAIGVASAVTGPVTLTPVGASVYVLLDLPEISTAQNTPCFLAAMTGVLTGWDGGSLMQSTDSGSTWVDLHDFGAPGCTMGTASTVIGSVDSRVMDNGSVLTVVLSQGILSSVTQLALFGGANYFAYGVNGRWEIIAAMTCTLVSGSTYTLSNFLRGRFGTEQYMGTHVIGDSIVLLDTVDLALIVMGVGTIGLPYLYRGITYDRDIGTDGDRTFAYSAVNLKPLAPIYLTGNRDSSNNWELTWIRRTRDGGEWRDNVDAALGEASEAYQIDIYSDGTYATVKRTISVTSPTAAYTSADQTADFGSNQGTLYLKLYQISATVGRGYPLTTSITR